MSVLENYEPRHVMKHFEKICSIPHPSGHEEALAAYIADFALSHGHTVERDDAGNVMVRMAATEGYENVPPMLLQAHMDMVPAKKDWSTHNFVTDPIELRIEGHYLYANGTTLGADNAVGMVNMLALMEDESVIHPELELLFTVGEEVGMIGIRALDFSKVRSRRMMNMDCGDHNVMCVSCAGSAYCLTRIPVKTCKRDAKTYRLDIGGLQGGHSGICIDMGRASAVNLTGRILCDLADHVKYHLVSAGCKHYQGIASEMSAVLAIEDIETARTELQRIVAELKDEFSFTEPDMTITLTEAEVPGDEMWDCETTRRLAQQLNLQPCAVTKRDSEEHRTILCSVNCTEVWQESDVICVENMVRAPIDPIKWELVRRFRMLAELLGGTMEITDAYSGWRWRRQSALQDLCRKVFNELTGEELTIEIENSCAETGFIAGAIPDMDIVAMAPWGRGAHTPDEHTDLDTFLPFWKFLTGLLAEMCREAE